MQIIETVRFEGGEDSNIINRFHMLEGWTGMYEREEDDPVRRAFRKIRGNMPSLEDIRFVLEESARIAVGLAETAETATCPFPEIPGRGASVEEDWRNGLREQPGRILREIETINDLFEDALGVTVFRKEEEAVPEP